MAAALGIGLGSRKVREVRKVYLLLLSLLGDLESWRYGGVLILLRNKRCSLAQEAMLRCAIKGWLVAQGG